MIKEIGLYIHIPFCARKCAYCDFSSYAGRETDMNIYVERLLEEAKQKARADFRIATLYIGGGTPSLLPVPLMERLLSSIRKLFTFQPDAECTCECNPGAVSPSFFQMLRQNGINRLSFGAQASQPHALTLLGRIHSWDDVIHSVGTAKAAGFSNINLDLMLGLPGQTLDEVNETLDKALALSPMHLSCYGLIVEEGTKMHAMVECGKWQLPGEDTERAMYELCRRKLAECGMQQYEISNFALPGYACRHNTDCWKRKEYLGLGAAACGFLNETRFQNPASLDDYLAGIPPEITPIFPEDARFESIMLGLRMMEGVSEEAFFRMHGVSLRAAYGRQLQKSLDDGLVVIENGYLRLTRRGMDVQNMILVELL